MSARVTERFHAEHDNIAQLLLVLESHLALMNDDEPFDAAVMLEALDYLIDYVQDFHRHREDDVVATLSARHDAIQTSGAELYHRLDLAVRNDTVNRAEVIHLAYAYCRELRRLMAVEEHAFSQVGDDAGTGANANATAAVARRDEAPYRTRYEDLTRRIGCACAYARR